MTDIQAAGIIIGLFISGFGLLLNAIATFKNISSRKLTNYQDIIKSHRDLWKITLDKPEKFERLFLKELDLNQSPITYEESRFINLLILHMTSGYYFSKGSDLIEVEMMKHDIDDFFTYPIPKQVWENTKWYYNKDFRLFIDTPLPAVIKHLDDTERGLPDEKLRK
jgi:hypothetical protein